MKMGSISVLVIAVLVIGFGGSAFKKHQKKQKEIAEAEQVLADLQSLEKPMQDFSNESKLAVATPRIQLSPQVARMQDTLKSMNDVHTIGCATDAKNYMKQGMQSMIDSLMSFMLHSDIKSDLQSEEAITYIAKYKESVDLCTQATKKKLDDLRS